MNKALILFLSLMLLASCEQAASQVSGDRYPSQQENFKLEKITGELVHPWSVAFLKGGDYLVTERRGKLWRVLPTGQKFEITGMPKVYETGQGGLLDIALEPNFENGGWLYFSYSATAPNDKSIANTEVARAKLNLGSNTLGDAEIIFRATPKVKGDNHWGSRLLFAPDGNLFITLGERFNYSEEAQNPQNHLGTIVRIKPNGDIPNDNPFANNKDGIMPRIYSYGHRNVQGIALNLHSGDIWAHEHGPKGGDEINILKSGANYGWPKVTFGINYWGTKITDLRTAPGMEDPILQWTPSIAPSGMAFYEGDQFPNWQGDLFVGALAGQHLRRLELEGDKIIAQETLLENLDERIRDVRVYNGEIYILTDSEDGALLKLVPAQ